MNESNPKANDAHRLTKVLNHDIWYNILSLLDVISLTNAKNTSKQLEGFAQHTYYARYLGLLRKYFENPGATSMFLDQTRSIISGSSALQFCLNDGRWAASDLDIYSTRDGYEYVKQHVVSRAYTLIQEYDFYGTTTRMLRVAKFRNGELTIDIIQSEDDLAVSPLDGFWGSTPMNAITCRGYTIAYPQLTLHNLGIVHHSGMVDHQRIETRTHIAKYKYEQRDYVICLKPINILPILRTHLCSADMCTHKLRWFGDSHCAMGIFLRGRESKTLETAQWVIGGDHCQVQGCTHSLPVTSASAMLIREAQPDRSFPVCCEAFSSRVSRDQNSLFSAM